MRFITVIAGCGFLCAMAVAAIAEGERYQTAAVVPATLIEAPPQTPSPKSYDTLTVVIGGDLGLNPSGQPVSADRVVRHGQSYAFDDLIRGLKPLLAGDVVFANLETVVTDRNDLVPIDKAFNFRTHPAAVRRLVASGFNVLSTANNHAVDYGEAGIAETVRHLASMSATGLRGAPGTGFGRASALAPADVNLGHARVRVSAVGIGGGAGLSGERAVMASYHGADFHEASRRLRDADGDVRLLSVHFGQEMHVRPAASDVVRLQEAVRAYDVDIVAGHHAHVAAGVQAIDGRLIFYGLGNLLHPGMQDMGKHGQCRDFGVVAKVHFGRANGDAYRVRAIEVWTLADMHAAVRIRTGDDGRARIDVLNHLAEGLDETRVRATGVRFTPQSDGRGLHCTARVGETNDALAQQCRDNGTPPAPPASVGRSCGRNDAIAATRRAPETVAISVLHRASVPPAVRAAPSWREQIWDR